MRALLSILAAISILGVANAQLVVKTGNDGVVYSPLPLGIPSPVLSGTITGTYTLGGNPSVSGATLSGSTILSPVFSGTGSGLLTLSGTFANGTYTSPSISGAGTSVSVSGSTGVLVLSGTPVTPVASQIVVSGTTLRLYLTGSTYIQFQGAALP